MYPPYIAPPQWARGLLSWEQWGQKVKKIFFWVFKKKFFPKLTIFGAKIDIVLEPHKKWYNSARRKTRVRYPSIFPKKKNYR